MRLKLEKKKKESEVSGGGGVAREGKGREEG